MIRNLEKISVIAYLFIEFQVLYIFLFQYIHNAIYKVTSQHTIKRKPRFCYFPYNGDIACLWILVKDSLIYNYLWVVQWLCVELMVHLGALLLMKWPCSRENYCYTKNILPGQAQIVTFVLVPHTTPHYIYKYILCI